MESYCFKIKKRRSGERKRAIKPFELGTGKNL